MPLTLKNFYKQWWQPWANTVLYYKFNNDLTDSSWNSRDLTLFWTVTYWVTSWWWKYAYFNTSAYTQNMSIGSIDYWADSYTVSFYWQPKTIYGFGNAHAVFDMTVDGGDPRWIRVTDSIWAWWNVSYNATINTWYHVVAIRTPTKVKLYINWTLQGTANRSQSGTFNVLFRINAIWNSTSLTNNNYLGEFIMEKRERTDTEILDYYNQTKSLYWIS